MCEAPVLSCSAKFYCPNSYSPDLCRKKKGIYMAWGGGVLPLVLAVHQPSLISFYSLVLLIVLILLIVGMVEIVCTRDTRLTHCIFFLVAFCWRGRGARRCSETDATIATQCAIPQRNSNAHTLTMPMHTAGDSYQTILSASD